MAISCAPWSPSGYRDHIVFTLKFQPTFVSCEPSPSNFHLCHCDLWPEVVTRSIQEQAPCSCVPRTTEHDVVDSHKRNVTGHHWTQYNIWSGQCTNSSQSTCHKLDYFIKQILPVSRSKWWWDSVTELWRVRAVDVLCGCALTHPVSRLHNDRLWPIIKVAVLSQPYGATISSRSMRISCSSIELLNAVIVNHELNCQSSWYRYLEVICFIPTDIPSLGLNLFESVQLLLL
jgi:hypothetical protein